MKNIIRYIVLALVIVGVVIAMRSLFKNSSSKWDINTNEDYSVTIKLLDKETKDYLNGSKMVLKTEKGTVIEEWTTNDKSYTVNKLSEGTYILEQKTVPTNYESVDTTIKFKVVNKDKNIVMYNTKTNGKEAEESEDNSNKETTANNTVSNEVNVDNTLSLKNNITYIFSGIIILLGIKLITNKRCYNK